LTTHIVAAKSGIETPPAVVMTVDVVVVPSAVCPAVTGGVAPAIDTLLEKIAAVADVSMRTFVAPPAPKFN
jgi:hypothetical protein